MMNTYPVELFELQVLRTLHVRIVKHIESIMDIKLLDAYLCQVVDLWRPSFLAITSLFVHLVSDLAEPFFGDEALPKLYLTGLERGEDLAVGLEFAELE